MTEEQIREKLVAIAEGVLDEHFPKGESKDRGIALVVQALLNIEIAKWIKEEFDKLSLKTTK